MKVAVCRTGYVVALVLIWALTSGFFGSSVDPIKAGDKVGVVLMHGKGGTTRWVDSLASALRSAGARVVTPDMPWHQNRIYDKTFEDAMVEIHQHVSALKAEGAERLFVAGHSLGAVAAAGYGASYDDIDGVMLLAPGHFVSAYGFAGKMYESVKQASTMIDQGRGAERASFSDINAGKRTSRNLTAEIYHSWFAPDGPADFVTNMTNLKPGTAVLYVAGSRDKIPHTQDKDYAFKSVPPSVHNAFEVVKSNHLDVPSKARKNVAAWLDRVTSFDPQATAADLVGSLDSGDSAERRAAVEDLRLLGADAAPALIGALQSPTPAVRETAAGLLGGIPSPAVTDALIDSLNDSDSEVRWSIVTALEEIGDPSALAPIEALSNDPDDDVRDAVADAVAALKR